MSSPRAWLGSRRSPAGTDERHAVPVIYGPYSDTPPLDGYYFEDSWVLAIETSNVGAVLTIEAVLTPQHPKFGPPRPGEKYAYERIALRFDDAQTVSFSPSGAAPATDASGEKDLGNIDYFGIGPAGSYVLKGDWGTLEMEGANLSVDSLG